MKLVLASASPRRKTLLEQSGYELILSPVEFDEIKAGSNPREVAEKNAVGKCRFAVQKNGDKIPVAAADTIVVLDNEIIGKPLDSNDARATLHKLSGKMHLVLTGIAVAYKGRMISTVAVTKVFFNKLDSKAIDDYVATGQPLDKAGSYGIQDESGFMIEHIEGNLDNVIGLDVTALKDLLQQLGVQTEE